MEAERGAGAELELQNGPERCEAILSQIASHMLWRLHHNYLNQCLKFSQFTAWKQNKISSTVDVGIG